MGEQCSPTTHAPCDGSDTQQFETFRYAGADVWRSRDGLWLHQDPDSKGLLACTALNEKAQINQVRSYTSPSNAYHAWRFAPSFQIVFRM